MAKFKFCCQIESKSVSVGTVRQDCKDSIVNGNENLTTEIRNKEKVFELPRQENTILVQRKVGAKRPKRTMQSLSKRTFLSQLIDSEDVSPAGRKRKVVPQKETVNYGSKFSKLQFNSKPASYGLDCFSVDVSDQ